MVDCQKLDFTTTTSLYLFLIILGRKGRAILRLNVGKKLSIHYMLGFV